MKKLIVVGVVAVFLLLPVSASASRGHGIAKRDPITCVLSQDANGDLVVSGTGDVTTDYQWELYSTPPSTPGAQDGASVGGGEFTTDSTGADSDDLGPLSFFRTVYPDETTLTLDVYPIVGNHADLTTLLGTCSITP